MRNNLTVSGFLVWVIFFASCSSELKPTNPNNDTTNIKVTEAQLAGNWQLTSGALLKPLDIPNIFVSELMKDAWCLENSKLEFKVDNLFTDYSSCNVKNESGTFRIENGNQVYLNYQNDSLGTRLYEIKKFAAKDITFQYVDSVVFGGSKIGFLLNYRFVKL
jgi:hypothetical protein